VASLSITLKLHKQVRIAIVRVKTKSFTPISNSFIDPLMIANYFGKQ